MNSVMEHPFPKSTPVAEKCKRLSEVVAPEDRLAILINADPDAIAAALALKRLCPSMVAVSPERRPGARRIMNIRTTIEKRGAVCVFSEPQFRPAMVKVVMEGSQARHGVLDPLGVGLTPGKEQWFQLMQNLADNLYSCLSGDL